MTLTFLKMGYETVTYPIVKVVLCNLPLLFLVGISITVEKKRPYISREIFNCDENTSGTPRILIEVVENFIF